MYMNDLEIQSTWLLLCTVLSLIGGLILQQLYNTHIRKYPPGPVGVPIYGYLPFLGGHPHKALSELSKKYGNVFSLYFGPSYTVIVNDYNLAKEILCHPAAISRPRDLFAFIPGEGGFAGNNGEEWQDQRRFCIQSMKNLGMGRGQWETIIQDDVAEFVRVVAGYGGKPADIKDYLIRCGTSNNMGLLIGRRLPKKESNLEVNTICDAHHVLIHHFSVSSANMIAPWISKYLEIFHISGYHKSAKILKDFSALLRKEIYTHMDSGEHSHTADFIGLYLAEMKRQEASGKKHYFSVDNLVGHIVVLFFAGMDTTISSIHWLFLLMASRLEVQNMVQKELDDVVGIDGQVFWNDRFRLPYTMATILEAERWVSINPLYAPRSATRSFEVSGLTIPKGSTIIGNSWAMMHDEKYWEKPHEFIPERFLPLPTTHAMKFDGYCPFSFGKRNCPGESVAMMTIILFFTAVMQKFTVMTPSGGPADLEAKYGIVLHPVDQELCFKDR